LKQTVRAYVGDLVVWDPIEQSQKVWNHNCNSMKLEKCLKKRTEFDTRIEDSLSLILYGYDVSNSIHFAVKPRASEHEMCREASKAMISSVIQPLSIRYATTMALARYYESKTQHQHHAASTLEMLNQKWKTAPYPRWLLHLLTARLQQ